MSNQKDNPTKQTYLERCESRFIPYEGGLEDLEDKFEMAEICYAICSPTD